MSLLDLTEKKIIKVLSFKIFASCVYLKSKQLNQKLYRIMFLNIVQKYPEIKRKSFSITAKLCLNAST